MSGWWSFCGGYVFGEWLVVKRWWFVYSGFLMVVGVSRVGIFFMGGGDVSGWRWVEVLFHDFGGMKFIRFCGRIYLSEKRKLQQS